MVIKIYASMISCSQEVRKNQQRAVMILESKNVPYAVIDITDPANEESKDYMVENAKPPEGSKVPVTPQIFNEAEYCGDFNEMDMANECDTLGDFLKLTDEEKSSIKIGITSLGQKDSIANGQEEQIGEIIQNDTEINLENENTKEEDFFEENKIDDTNTEEAVPEKEIESTPLDEENEQVHQATEDEQDIPKTTEDVEMSETTENVESNVEGAKESSENVESDTKNDDESTENVKSEKDNENVESVKEEDLSDGQEV